MSDRGQPPEWAELRVSDSAFDAPEDAEFSSVVLSRPSPAGPPAGAAVPTRWCAGLAVVALIAAAGGIAFAGYRGRTVTTVRTVTPPPNGVDASGCPRGDTCSALDGLYGGLAQATNTDLPANVELFATELIDNSAVASTRRVRIVQLKGSGIRVMAISQCRPDRPRLAAWSRDLAGVGPKLAVLVTPGSGGCSLALLAQVPDGTPVPAAALRALAADPNTAGG